MEISNNAKTNSTTLITTFFVTTIEEVAKIQKFDKVALDNFFNNNNSLLIALAKKYRYRYFSNRGNSVDYLEIFNQFYIDIPFIISANKQQFFCKLNCSARFVEFGGYYHKLPNIATSIDKPIGENFTISDTLSTVFDFDNIVEQNNEFDNFLLGVSKSIFPNNQEKQFAFYNWF